jgi:hypothetical protein
LTIALSWLVESIAAVCTSNARTMYSLVWIFVPSLNALRISVWVSYLVFSSTSRSVIRALLLRSLQTLVTSLIPNTMLMSLTSSSPVWFLWLSDLFPGLMINCLVCTGRTGLVCLVFPSAGKIRALVAITALAALVAFVAFVALVAPVAVSPVIWPRTWEYVAGLGPSCFASLWTVLESSLSSALISVMSWAWELLPDMSWLSLSTPGSLASPRAFLTYSYVFFICSVGLLLVRKSLISWIALVMVSWVVFLLSSVMWHVTGGLPFSIPASTQRCMLQRAGSRF